MDHLPPGWICKIWVILYTVESIVIPSLIVILTFPECFIQSMIHTLLVLAILLLTLPITLSKNMKYKTNYWQPILLDTFPLKCGGFVQYDRFPPASYAGPLCPVLSYFLLVSLKMFNLLLRIFSQTRPVYLPFDQKPLNICAALTKATTL